MRWSITIPSMRQTGSSIWRRWFWHLIPPTSTSQLFPCRRWLQRHRSFHISRCWRFATRLTTTVMEPSIKMRLTHHLVRRFCQDTFGDPQGALRACVIPSGYVSNFDIAMTATSVNQMPPKYVMESQQLQCNWWWRSKYRLEHTRYILLWWRWRWICGNNAFILQCV